MSEQPQGIKGLEGSAPIGARVTIGIKGPRGFPIERDRFHIVAPRADGNDVKPHHPRFKSFNTAPPERRQYIEGVLVHATRAECFSFNLRCQSPKKVPQRQRPAGRAAFCTGDGERARRWDSGKGGYADIVCPHDRCEFRQPQSERMGPACKPFSTLTFQLHIPAIREPFPSLQVKFSTGAWSTTRNLLGLFQDLEAKAANIGMEGHSLFGFRFAFQLNEGRSADGRNRYPVVDVSPLDDVLGFLAGQRERMQQLGAERRLALTDRSTDDVDRDHAEYAAPGARVEED